MNHHFLTRLNNKQKQRKKRQSAYITAGVFFLIVAGTISYSHNVIGVTNSERLEEKHAAKKISWDEWHGVSQEKIFDYTGVDTIQLKPIKKENVEDLNISKAHSSIILDVDSGTILHYDEGREKRQIASLTKMMTALLVMENVKDLDELVTIDKEVVFVDGTKIGCPRSGYCISKRLSVGEKISVRNLLKAMLMNSANDAALALGKHISGTKESFVALMNARTEDLGLRDSHFCTPSGLEIDGREEECYSSAYDIARIAAKTLEYDLIWQIMLLPSHTEISSSDGTYTHDILNTNPLLDTVPYMLGAKTGFTPHAGQALLMAGVDKTKKHRVIAVVLDDPDRWNDAQKMLEWTFKSHDWE